MQTAKTAAVPKTAFTAHSSVGTELKYPTTTPATAGNVAKFTLTTTQTARFS